MKPARAMFPIAAAALFAIWLAALLFGGPEWTWDRQVLAAFHTSHDSDLLGTFRFITDLGGWIPLSILGVIGAIVLAFTRRMRAALLLIILFGGRLLVEVQKFLFGSPRPPISGHLVPTESLGFPSGHAGNSMITLLALALLIPVGQRNRALAAVLAVVLAVLIGLSRLVLGVHWPSDVIGGWAFGLLWVMLCLRAASARPEPETAETGAAQGTLGPPSSFPWRRRRKHERREQPRQ